MFFATHLVGFMAGRSVVRTQVPQATGTAIGNATDGGGLAAAFDSNTSQTQAGGAEKLTSVSGYSNFVGKDWGAGNSKIITKLIMWGPTDAGIINSVDKSFKLQGSTDNFAASTVDLYTSGVIAGSGSSNWTATFDGDALGFLMSTAYRYHRVAWDGNGVNGFSLAELQFWEDI